MSVFYPKLQPNQLLWLIALLLAGTQLWTANVNLARSSNWNNLFAVFRPILCVILTAKENYLIILLYFINLRATQDITKQRYVLTIISNTQW